MSWRICLLIITSFLPHIGVLFLHSTFVSRISSIEAIEAIEVIAHIEAIEVKTKHGAWGMKIAECYETGSSPILK